MNVLQLLKRHRVLIVLIVVALALRVWYWSINPLWPQYSNADDGDYYRRALRLAVTGNYVDDAWLIRPPLHVWVFAAWIKLGLLLGQPPAFGVRLIQGFHVLLGAAMVPLCYGLAARLFAGSRANRAGLIFAALWAVWFPFIELPVTLFSEPIYLFLFALHLWLLLRFDDSGNKRYLVLSGLVLGMAALTRSPALYALAFAVPWLLLRFWQARQQETAPAGWQTRLRHALRQSLGPLAILVACTFVVVLPWTIRNYIEYRHIILVDTLGPINLWLDLDEAGARDAKINQLQALPQADRQDYATAQVRAILREDPLRPFRNVWPTFRHIWKAQYVEDFWIKRSFFTRPLREAAPLGLLGDILWLGFSFAGVVGLLHPRTDRPFKVLVALWLLYSFATVLVFHVEPRYLLSIWLLLSLYAAWTLSQGWSWITDLRGLQRGWWRGWLVYGTLAALALLIVTYRNYPSILARGIQREWAMLQGNRAYARGDFAAAEQGYRAALAADPGFVDTEIALALALGAQRQPQKAISVLTPQASRRSILLEGLFRRALTEDAEARGLLRTIEQRTGEDTQHWALAHVPVEQRDSLVLGDDALDLGYIAGFAGAERVGERSYRWLSGNGSVVLPLLEPLVAGAEVQIEMAAPIALDGVLHVRLNDHQATLLRPNADWRTYHLAVPPGLAGQTRLRLELNAPTYLPMHADPTSDDARALSVMVHRVAVNRGPSTPTAHMPSLR